MPRRRADLGSTRAQRRDTRFSRNASGVRRASNADLPPNRGENSGAGPSPSADGPSPDDPDANGPRSPPDAVDIRRGDRRRQRRRKRRERRSRTVRNRQQCAARHYSGDAAYQNAGQDDPLLFAIAAAIPSADMTSDRSLRSTPWAMAAAARGAANSPFRASRGSRRTEASLDR